MFSKGSCFSHIYKDFFHITGIISKTPKHFFFRKVNESGVRRKRKNKTLVLNITVKLEKDFKSSFNNLFLFSLFFSAMSVLQKSAKEVR